MILSDDFCKPNDALTFTADRLSGGHPAAGVEERRRAARDGGHHRHAQGPGRDRSAVIDRNGKVSHVVIGVGGGAGVGEKKVVVPWSELKFAPVTEGKKNAITMDEAKLEKRPPLRPDGGSLGCRTGRQPTRAFELAREG